MKNYYVMTLFPDMIMQAVSYSIISHAIEDEHIHVEAVNIRDYTHERHGHVDDEPYGGGAGMLMQVQPIYNCCRSIQEKIPGRARVLYMSPRGRRFDQQIAMELSGEDALIFLCGHYEGVDERALQLLSVEELSIGDYVLTGGELPALVIIDAVARLLPGVLKKPVSHEIESFSEGLLEYPQYTRPREFMGMEVPPILLSGDHQKVDEWRQKESLIRTREQRPDLFNEYVRTHPEDRLIWDIIE